jgi:hypothetical protein
VPPCGSATSGMGTGERCNQASLHNRRQLSEQNRVGGQYATETGSAFTPTKNSITVWHRPNRACDLVDLTSLR